jgi:hypothetical protein
MPVAMPAGIEKQLAIICKYRTTCTYMLGYLVVVIILPPSSKIDSLLSITLIGLELKQV